MTKYILLDWGKDKKLIEKYPNFFSKEKNFIIEDGSNNEFFICTTCFAIFPQRSLIHLDKCRMEWPYSGSLLCKEIKAQHFRIYRIYNDEDIITKKILRAISRLGQFSKQEQNLDSVISSEKLLSKGRTWTFQGSFQHFYYILFLYKNIKSYLLLDVYQSYLTRNKMPIIRDIFTFPLERGKGYAGLLLSEVARQFRRKVADLWFSEPLAPKLKNLLKNHYNLSEVRVIQGMNLRTRRNILL